MRKFESGATRDTVAGKLSYVKGLSPAVLKRYLQYLSLHRKQPDGSMREFDNWKKGIEKDVYLDSLGRHFVDVWLLHNGYPAEDNHGPVDIESALCAIMFNSMGMLHEILKDGTSPGYPVLHIRHGLLGWYIGVGNDDNLYLRDDLVIHDGTGATARRNGKQKAYGYYLTKGIAEAYVKAYEEKHNVK